MRRAMKTLQIAILGGGEYQINKEQVLHSSEIIDMTMDITEDMGNIGHARHRTKIYKQQEIIIKEQI